MTICRGNKPLNAEVWNWDSVQLDFALAGVDNCGTTSLMRNLVTGFSIQLRR